MPGNNTYRIEYDSKVVREDIPAIGKSAKNLIIRAIEERLTTDPLYYGKPLRYSLHGHRRIRVSNYRIVYRIDELSKTVYIMNIFHRKEGYD